MLCQQMLNTFHFSSSLSHVQLFSTPWTAACQASLSITNPQSLLKLMSIKLVMPSNHLILCHPLLLLPLIFPTIRVFSKESVLCIRWPKYWSFVTISFLFLKNDCGIMVLPTDSQQYAFLLHLSQFRE